jgi:hypothetical protein
VEDKMFGDRIKYRPFSFGEGIRGMRPGEAVRFQTPTVRFRTLLYFFFLKPLPGKAFHLGMVVEIL